jgi:hypothetical protein
MREQLDAGRPVLFSEAIRSNTTAKVWQEIAVKGGHHCEEK